MKIEFVQKTTTELAKQQTRLLKKFKKVELVIDHFSFDYKKCTGYFIVE